jgi:hypothetical protein
VLAFQQEFEAEEFGDPVFEPPVQCKRSADESNRRCTGPKLVVCRRPRSDDLGCVAETQVVVRAQVDYFTAELIDTHNGILR